MLIFPNSSERVDYYLHVMTHTRTRTHTHTHQYRPTSPAQCLTTLANFNFQPQQPTLVSKLSHLLPFHQESDDNVVNVEVNMNIVTAPLRTCDLFINMTVHYELALIQ